MSKVLLIDIGGTNLRYAYADGDLSSLKDTNKIKLSCIKGFNDILANLIEGKNIDNLVISVAGPKINGSITMTNRDFSINEKDIQESFNFQTCHLLNDWESIGHSLAAYEDKDISLIKDGSEFNNNSFFIGPGTGLGAALLIGDDKVTPTEIGNTTGLTKTLLKNYFIENDDHFRTLEDVLSGKAISSIYEYKTGVRMTSEDIVARYGSNDDMANLVIDRKSVV